MTSESLDDVTLNVQLDPKDLDRFRTFVGVPSRARTYRNLAVLLGVALLLGFSLTNRYGGSRPSGAGSNEAVSSGFSVVGFFAHYPWMPFVVLFFGTVGFFYWRSTRPSALEAFSPGLFKPMAFAPTEHGFLCRTDRGENLNYWHIVTRFVETPEVFYVMIVPRNGHILPKRCFETAEAMALFQNRMRLYLEKFAPAALAASQPA